MAWYKQLDNDGKETGYKRFFTENQERALKTFKRARWIKIDGKEKSILEPEKPTKVITLVDIHNANTVKELDAVAGQTKNPNLLSAIEKKKQVLLTKNK